MLLYGPQIVKVSSLPQPNATFRIVQSVDGTNASLVKASGGSVVNVTGFNTKSVPVYLKLYDENTVPNVGVDVPERCEFLPAQDRFELNFGGLALKFSSGIGFAFTTEPQDADATPIAAGDIMGINLSYY